MPPFTRANSELFEERKLYSDTAVVLNGHGMSNSGQCDALRRFYISIEMDSVSSRQHHNWVFGNATSTCDYCAFTGVTFDCDNYVAQLNLNDTGLSGKLPDMFDELSCSKRLQVHDNSISGSIPNSLRRISNLVHLNIGQNYMSGEFPDLSELYLLSRLVLDRNAFSGTLPSSLCKLTKLELLGVSYLTKVGGQIPACLGSLPVLSTFLVTDVGFTGTVPSELCCERPMNGISLNPFECNAVACPEGSFEPNGGRQRNRHSSCMPCNVPSNVIGSTTCQWCDGFASSAPTTGGTQRDNSPQILTYFPSSSEPPTMLTSKSPSSPAPLSSSFRPPSAMPPSSTPSISPTILLKISESKTPTISPAYRQFTRPTGTTYYFPTSFPSSFSTTSMPTQTSTGTAASSISSFSSTSFPSSFGTSSMPTQIPIASSATVIPRPATGIVSDPPESG